MNAACGFAITRVSGLGFRALGFGHTRRESFYCQPLTANHENSPLIMKLLYLGSGEFGLPTLRQLHEQHELVAVVTQPDRPAGRKRRLTPTPIAQWAQQQGVTVFKSDDVNTADFISRIAALQVDAGIVIAFGQKLSPQLIAGMGRLAVNLHASLLPKYRGAAPINWAMIQGETVTGVSVIGLAQKMDAGEIYATASLDIDPRETAGELHDRLAQLGPQVVCKVLDDLAGNRLRPLPQKDEKATRAPKLTKADGTVDFDMPAAAVRCRIHGLTPWPGCRVNWFCQQTGKSDVLILRRAAVLDSVPGFIHRWFEAHGQPQPGTVLPQNIIACGNDITCENPHAFLRLLEVQGPGTTVMTSDAFSLGHHLGPGDRLTTIPATPSSG